MHFEYEPLDFLNFVYVELGNNRRIEVKLDHETCKAIAERATQLYREHVFQQPKLYGIKRDDLCMGFDSLRKPTSNVGGYLVETVSLKDV